MSARKWAILPYIISCLGQRFFFVPDSHLYFSLLGLDTAGGNYVGQYCSLSSSHTYTFIICNFITECYAVHHVSYAHTYPNQTLQLLHCQLLKLFALKCYHRNLFSFGTLFTGSFVQELQTKKRTSFVFVLW